MAASNGVSLSSGNGRVRPHPLLARRDENRDKLLEIRSAVTNKKITALLVDGDRFFRMIQTGFLRHHCVLTEDLDNGQAAVDLFASGATFSLVFLDINLPQLSGLEVTRRIRAMGIPTNCRHVPSILSKRAFMEAGADQVIEKPLVPETLVPILMDLVCET